MTSPFGPVVCAQSVRLYAVATSRRTFWFKASFEPPCPSGVFQSDPSLTPFSSYCHGGPGSGHAEEVVDERAPRHPLSRGDDESVGDRVVHEEPLQEGGQLRGDPNPQLGKGAQKVQMSRDSRGGRSNNTRTTAKAKGRKESFPGQRNPPPPRRLLHETGTRCPVHSGVVYSESLVAETGP